MTPIYHIDANNSGAWKRVLRDVKAGTLPEVLRAIALAQRPVEAEGRNGSGGATGCAATEWREKE